MKQVPYFGAPEDKALWEGLQWGLFTPLEHIHFFLLIYDSVYLVRFHKKATFCCQ